MKDEMVRSILPYTCIVGQRKLKLALELAYIAPRIGGVLLSGKRGTAKSTAVRAFACMLYDALPVTIPINATEDRVVGGWRIDELLKGQPVEQPGLVEEANGKLLYIDEVNLLDDHIVNILLDVTSTGKLVIQREGRGDQRDVQVTLVATMNPEEGGLRPQLLDRFGLMVGVETEEDPQMRRAILETVLNFDRALLQERQGQVSAFLEQARAQTARYREKLERARELFPDVELSASVAEKCIALADGFKVEGHRSDYLLALAACACAARKGNQVTTLAHLRAVAELVLRHRQPNADQFNYAPWGHEQEQLVITLLE
ncbi:MAG TPA: AAA family ATPase [Ktedonobacteraceae bacterium]|jgi:magnesium chelatase subunit I|nr:AAA family ATPase [Ktedonobacteraceae bacterium]